MIRLNLKTTAHWLDLGHGVKIKVQPLSTAIMSSCRRDPRVMDVVRAQKLDTAATEPADLTGEAGDAIALAMAKAVARRVVSDWSGVGDENGKAVKISPEGLDALLDIWVMFEAFQQKYLASGLMLESEKNGLSPSLNGTSAGARRTAVPAKGRAQAARKS